MPEVDPSVIVHGLNVDPAHKLVIQKSRRFNPKRYMAISEKVDKLLKAKFIREAHYLEWLANVVMVKNTTENGGSVLTTQTSIKHARKTPSRLQGSTNSWMPLLDTSSSASWIHTLGTTKYAYASRMRIKQHSQ